VLEELGVQCEVLGPRVVDVDWSGPEGCVFILIHFDARLSGDEFAANEEVVRYAWVAPGEVERYNAWPNVRRLAESLMQAANA